MAIGLLVYTGGMETGVIGAASAAAPGWNKYGWSYALAWASLASNTITFVVGMKVGVVVIPILDGEGGGSYPPRPFKNKP